LGVFVCVWGCLGVWGVCVWGGVWVVCVCGVCVCVVCVWFGVCVCGVCVYDVRGCVCGVCVYVFWSLLSGMQITSFPRPTALPSVACPAIPHFSTLFHKRRDFRIDIIKPETCVVILHTTFFLKSFSF